MKKENKKINTIGALALIAAISLNALPLNVLALSKEETVYTKMNTDGSVREVLVNEHLINDKKLDTIDDYSELENILNINDDKTFTRSDNKLTWNADGKDMFYRGSTKKELPIKLNINLFLDGEKKKLDDILGKKGRITIELKYTNLDSHKINGSTLYTPFTVTAGTVLDATKCTNITVKNGKVVSTGTKNMIAGIAMPGLYDSLKISELEGTDKITISFDTDEFNFPSIYSVATPKLVSESDLSIFDKMDSLYTGIDELKTNMDKIEAGSHALKDGSSTLKNALGSSISSMTSSSNKDVLDEATLNAIKKQSVDMVSKTFTEEYKETLGEATWSTVKSSLSANDPNATEIVSSKVTEAVADYLRSVGEYEDYTKCKRAEATMNAGSTPDPIDLNSCQVIANDKTLPFVISAATTAATDTAKSVSMYTAEKVSKTIAPQVAETTAISTAENLSTALATNVANQVKNASVKAISGSLDTLYKGVSSLDKGIEELDNGITEFNKEGISKIYNTVNNNLKPTVSRVKSLTSLGDNYQSFGSKLDSTEGETKFIMIVDAKNAPKENKTKEVKEEKTTLWERIKNLFK